MWTTIEVSIIPINEGPMNAPQNKKPQTHIPKYIKFSKRGAKQAKMAHIQLTIIIIFYVLSELYPP